MKVSYLEKFQLKGEIDILNALNLGQNFKEQIDKIRSVDRKNNEKLYKQMKMQLPSFTISCVCGKSRKLEDVKQINNVIAIDIDEHDNPTLSVDEIKEIVNNMPFVRYSALSVGGKGIFCLIPFKKQYANINDFIGVFNALQIDFKLKGIVIDKQCKDINHLRFISYDDNAYNNKHCEIYSNFLLYPCPTIDDVLQVHRIVNKERTFIPPTFRDKMRLKEAFDYIQRTHLIVTTNHSETLKLCNVFYSAFGEVGRNCIHILRMQRSGYDQMKVDNTFDYVMEHTHSHYNLGFFFKLYNEAINNNQYNKKIDNIKWMSLMI